MGMVRENSKKLGKKMAMVLNCILKLYIFKKFVIAES